MDLLWITENVLMKEFLIGIKMACTLSCVSKRFRDLFENEKFWKYQFETSKIDHILEPHLKNHKNSWKEMFINYHLLKTDTVERNKIKFDGPIGTPSSFNLREFLPQNEQSKIQSILALRKKGPAGTHEDGEEEAVFLLNDNTYLYYYSLRHDVHSMEHHYYRTTSTTATTLDELWSQIMAKEQGCYSNPGPLDSKIRLGFFTEVDLATWISNWPWNLRKQSLYYPLSGVKAKRYKKYINIFFHNKFNTQMRIMDTNSIADDICKICKIGWRRVTSAKFTDQFGQPVVLDFDQLDSVTDVYVTEPPPRVRQNKK